jgi:hypothetical protein
MAGFLSFKLSSRHLAKVMAERNLSMTHTTIMRWVYHYARIRASLEPTRTASWVVVARRRDLREGPRPVGVCTEWWTARERPWTFA